MGCDQSHFSQPRSYGYVPAYLLFGLHTHVYIPGSISFQYPTVTGNDTTIEGTAKNLTPIIAEIVQPWIVNGTWHTTYLYQGVDAGLWYNNTDFLLLVANMNSSEVIVPWSGVGLSVVTNATKQVQRIFSVAQNFDEHGLNFRPGGIGIYTATLY